MTWLESESDGATPFEAVLGLRPELLGSFRHFYSLFWERRLVDPVLLELCRLRVAGLLGCRAELCRRYRPALDAGLEEARVAELEGWRRSSVFTDSERAALHYTDRFVLDPHGIEDEDVASLVASLGEPGFVALTEALAIFDGFTRFRAMLEIESAPPVGDASELEIVDPPSGPEAGHVA